MDSELESRIESIFDRADDLMIIQKQYKEAVTYDFNTLFSKNSMKISSNSIPRTSMLLTVLQPAWKKLLIWIIRKPLAMSSYLYKFLLV